MRASARHLKDLRRGQRQPPADVPVNERGVPKFVPPIIEQSYCTSPAALCVELGEMVEDLPLGADLAEPDEAWAWSVELAEEIL